MKCWKRLLRNVRKITSIFFLQLNINDTKTATHEYISSKKLEKLYRIFKVLTDSTRNKEKIMSSHNKNTHLLFLTTFRCTNIFFLI